MQAINKLNIVVKQLVDVAKTYYYKEPNHSRKKKIVIVGVSFAGIELTKKLINLDKDQQFEILLIDKNEYFEFVCTNTIGLTDETHLPRTLISMTKLRESFRSSAVAFKRARLVNVSDKNQSIDVEIQKKSSIASTKNILEVNDQHIRVEMEKPEIESINYDYLVICTGSQYDIPLREDYQINSNTKQRYQSIDQIRSEIKRQKRIGCRSPQGLQGSGKKLGIITRNPRLLPSMPHQASTAAEAHLKREGVFVYLNSEYTSQLKQEMDYDYVINCVGNRFDANKQFMKGDLADCLDKHTSQIYVNEYMMVTNKNPLDEDLDSKSDVCLTRANEEKSVLPIHILSNILANNIMILSKKLRENGEQLKLVPEVIPRFYVIPLGHQNGIIVWNDFVVAGKIGVLIKTMLEKMIMATLNNSIIADYFMRLQYKATDGLFWVCSTRVFSCFPCHENRARRRTNKDDKKILKSKIQELENIKQGLQSKNIKKNN
eukprot:403340890